MNKTILIGLCILSLIIITGAGCYGEIKESNVLNQTNTTEAVKEIQKSKFKEGIEYSNYTDRQEISYNDYGAYKLIKFRIGSGFISSYLQIIARCQDEVVCYTNDYDDGGLSCFRHKDLVEKYCNENSSFFTGGNNDAQI